MLPCPPLYLEEIRTTDIWLLLLVGAIFEAATRVLLLLVVKIKPDDLLRKENSLARQKIETEQKRKLGPSAFVETSKLERAVLAKEKELLALYDKRKSNAAKIEKYIKNARRLLNLLVFVLYYGVAVFVVQDDVSGFVFEADEAPGGGIPLPESVTGGSILQVMMFPASFLGLANKMVRFSLPEEHKERGVGALVVLWSSQVLVEKLMDAVDAYVVA